MRRPLLAAAALGVGGEQRGVSHDPLPRYDDPGNDGHAAYLRGVCRERGAGRVGQSKPGQSNTPRSSRTRDCVADPWTTRARPRRRSAPEVRRASPPG